ncbi:hypothetical protein HYX11_00150 [Candidatus Woesearchaeota archaeon]|nr:hypothetical protein [Candidatus Woesearchaeota archaeon]
MLETILKTGKKTLIGLTLASSFSCQTYAKRDYAEYPAYKKDIAFYNLEQIGKKICDFEFKITPTTFTCNEKICVVGNMTCLLWDSNKLDFEFTSVEGITQKNNGINLQLSHSKDTSKKTLYFYNDRQAFDFAEALDIYIKELKR